MSCPGPEEWTDTETPVSVAEMAGFSASTEAMLLARTALWDFWGTVVRPPVTATKYLRTVQGLVVGAPRQVFCPLAVLAV